MTNFYIIFSILLGYLASAQNSFQEGSNDLKKMGMDFLERKITYANTNPLLSEALKSLHKEGINVIYSSSVLGTTPAPNFSATNRSLGEVMDNLLRDTKFDFIVIGNTLVIVSAKVTTDSLKTVKDSVQFRMPHVYSGHVKNFDHIPARDRRRVWQIFEKELQSYGLEIVPQKDTMVVQPLTRYPIYKICLQFGFANYQIKEQGLLSRAWSEELDYKSTEKSSGVVNLGLVREQKHYFIRAGVALQNLSIEYQWVEMKKNGAQVELPDKSNAQKLKYLEDKDQWLILSMPLRIGMIYRIRKHALIATLGLTYHRFERIQSSASDKFSDYYKVVSPESTYTEKYSKNGLSIEPSIQYSYRFLPKFSIQSNLAYAYFMNPITSNSVFKTYPHYWTVSVGINYKL